MDPTGTQVVDGRDLTKESTVGGLQYIRRDGSDFDRIFNPHKLASATPLLGVSLDEQNPKLTNIVLARRDLEREEDRGVRAQFTGGLEAEPLARDGKPQTTPSLQVSNFEAVRSTPIRTTPTNISIWIAMTSPLFASTNHCAR